MASTTSSTRARRRTALPVATATRRLRRAVRLPAGARAVDRRRRRRTVITLDTPAYRQQRIATPVLAWAVGLLPGVSTLLALLLVNAVALVVAAWYAARLAAALGRHPMWGLVLALPAGMPISLGRHLTEPVAWAAVLAGAVVRARPPLGAGLGRADGRRTGPGDLTGRRRGLLVAEGWRLLSGHPGPPAGGERQPDAGGDGTPRAAAVAVLRPTGRDLRPLAWLAVPVAVAIGWQLVLLRTWGTVPALSTGTGEPGRRPLLGVLGTLLADVPGPAATRLAVSCERVAVLALFCYAGWALATRRSRLTGGETVAWVLAVGLALSLRGGRPTSNSCGPRTRASGLSVLVALCRPRPGGAVGRRPGRGDGLLRRAGVRRPAVSRKKLSAPALMVWSCERSPTSCPPRGASRSSASSSRRATSRRPSTSWSGAIRGGAAGRGAARRDRHRQVGDDGVADRAAAAADPGDGAEQDARRPAGQRVPRAAAQQRRRVLRLLLRLLPARGVRPADGHVHREGLVGQRRGGAAAALGDDVAADPPGRGRGGDRVLHLRSGHPAGVRRPLRPAGGRPGDRAGQDPAQPGPRAVHPQRPVLHPRHVPGPRRHDRDLPGLRGARGPGRDVRRRDRAALLPAPADRRGHPRGQRGLRLPGLALRRRPGPDGAGDRRDRAGARASGWPSWRSRASCWRRSGCGCARRTTSR